MALEYVLIGDTSKKIAVDQVDTDKQVQYVKLMDGTTDSESPLTFATPITVSATPGIDASAYSDGDNLDGTIISFAAATATSGGSGYIDHLQIIDKSDSGGGGKNMLVVFCRSSITPEAQNAAFTMTDTQLEEVTAIVLTVDADWVDLGGGRIADCVVSPPVPYDVSSGTTLYAVVKLIGAWTFGSTSDVIVRTHFLRN